MNAGKDVPAGFIWCGQKGDLTLYLTHIKRGNGEDEEALYIRNERRKVESVHPVTGELAAGSPAYLVPFNDFWIYRPEDRDRGPHHKYGEIRSRLGNASVALYGIDAPDYRHRIHDAILEFADDVKNLAPPPEVDRQVWLKQMASEGVSLKLDGKRIH